MTRFETSASFRGYIMFLVCILSFVVLELKAQTVSFCYLKGNVFCVDDYEKEPYPLQSANVQAYCLNDTASNKICATSKEGYFYMAVFSKKISKKCRLRIRISYVGVEPLDTVVDAVKSTKKFFPGLGKEWEVSLGKVVLHSKPVTTEEAVIVGELKKMYMRGDTVVFNTAAYEMPTGSVLLELVRRLPGLRYEGGTLTYMGRNIEEMRLNGDTFFRHDISIALKNMPNDKLKKLLIYDVPVDTLDMNSKKKLVMDMQTDKPYTNTLFGNAKAGIADVDWTNMASGDASSYKKGGVQMSLNLATDNLPEKLVVSKGRRWTSLHGAYDNKFKGIGVRFSPDHIYDREENEGETLTRTFMPDFTQYSVDRDISLLRSSTVSFNLGLNGTLSGGWAWTTNLHATKRNTANGRTSRSHTYSDNPFVDDGHGEYLENELLDKIRINESNTSSQRDQDVLLMDWEGSVVKRFGENELGLKFKVHRDTQDGEETNRSEIKYFRFADSVSVLNRRVDSWDRENYVNTELYYNRKFGEHNFGLRYEMEYNVKKEDERYYNILGEQSDASALLQRVDSLTYNSKGATFFQCVSANLNLNWNLLSMKMGMSVRPTRLMVKTEHADGNRVDTSYVAPIFNPTMSVSFGSGGNNLELSYYGANSLPSIFSLMMVTNYMDPLHVTRGNSSLKQQFTHAFTLNAMLMQKVRIRSFLNVVENMVRSRTVYDSQTGVSYTSPYNINGNWTLDTSLGYATFLNNVTIDVSASHKYAHAVDVIQRLGESGSAKSVTNGHDLKISVGASYGCKFWQTQAEVTCSSAISKSDYLNVKRNSLFWKVKWNNTLNLMKYVDVQSRMTFNSYNGYELKSANKSEVYWELQCTYKFLKSRQMQVGIEWANVFGLDKSFSSQMSETSWTESRSFGRSGYVLLSLAYRFNRMK